MTNVLQKALALITGTGQSTVDFKRAKQLRPFRKLTERELIQLESEIGRTLFGEIPKGYTREFFNLDENTWIWHEEFKDMSGVKRSSTTRYEVKENGVLKAQDGAQYTYIEGEELRNLALAAQMYYEQVARNIYKRDPLTGQKLSR
jgi:hypothetical protein